jgi:hypothetical protein
MDFHQNQLCRPEFARSQNADLVQIFGDRRPAGRTADDMMQKERVLTANDPEKVRPGNPSVRRDALGRRGCVESRCDAVAVGRTYL